MVNRRSKTSGDTALWCGNASCQRMIDASSPATAKNSKPDSLHWRGNGIKDICQVYRTVHATGITPEVTHTFPQAA